jgi:flagellar protein FliS
MYRQNAGFEAYKKIQIGTANQGKLIVMLYDGAIKFVNIAINAVDEKKYDIVCNNLLRAQRIIDELTFTLDFNKGGEIAQNLMKIYQYMNNRLVEGNVKKDPEILREVVRYLESLRNAWNEIATRGGNIPQQSKTQNTSTEQPRLNIKS